MTKKMTRTEWLQERNKGIGSSDVAAVLGISPYKSNVELWEEKTGLREPEDISEKEYVQNGIKSEKPMIELFQVDYPQYEVKHQVNRHLINPEYEFIRCSPDALIVEKETGKKGFLETKRVEIRNANQYDNWKGGAIPQYYYTQTLQYFLADPQMEFGYLRAYMVNFGKEGIYRIEVRDYKIANSRSEIQADLDYLLPIEVEFWSHVVNKTRPAKILPNI